MEKISEMDEKQKKALVKKIHVSYPRLQAVGDEIADCHESKESGEPECLFICGPTGAGKTTARKEYARRFARIKSDEGYTVPVLSATIPVPATVKSVATKLLYELGDPAADKGTTGSQTLRLEMLAKDCSVEVIILDELQHFIDRDSQKILKTVSDWLKTLLEDTGIPIVLIGLPEAEGVLNANSQLSRRFANRHYLEPFRWDTNEKKEEFRKFLSAVESMLPLSEKSNLADEDMALRFYYASDGVVAYVMKLARYGTRVALKQRLEKLDLDVLAKAFDQHVRADKPHKTNHFKNERLDFEITPAEAGTMTGIKATNSRIKGKEQVLTAADVLR